ncbi:MAG: DAK2 domain-containing protein [Chloroflexi bacterium]|nr:DAK2 domain-containing protein [Chloroflexota bacterium]
MATEWLEKNAAAINALNVFPVPDGDTGTNMLLTMRSTMEAAASVSEDTASAVARAIAHGALMGARGNSGVILSQILKGVAEGFGGTACVTPVDLANALEKAYQLAYNGISKPKEGTILTVAKDAAAAARATLARDGHDLASLMDVVVREAQASLDRTPELLDVLKQAGVVDAGGQGLAIMLEGILAYLTGRGDQVRILETKFPGATQPALKAARSAHEAEGVYGYCTEFIVKGKKLDPERIRKKIETRGDSIVVVGDEEAVKVHIHTVDPGAVMHTCIRLGSLHDLKIQNMDDQNKEFLQMRGSKVPEANIAVVVVAAGDGLESIFRSLGATAIVTGGQTMNPSTQEILRAIDTVPSGKVIVLPNNKNVVLTAQQAASLARKNVNVLPTRSIPQGIASLIAFNIEVELDNNVAEMEKARRQVKSVEITRAVRGAKLGDIEVKEGAYIGLIDGDLKVAAGSLDQALEDSLREARVEKAEIITLYHGAEVRPEDAENLSLSLRKSNPGLQVDVIKGGQPHYAYIISVE